jgi:hypothetical protein
LASKKIPRLAVSSGAIRAFLARKHHEEKLKTNLKKATALNCVDLNPFSFKKSTALRTKAWTLTMLSKSLFSLRQYACFGLVMSVRILDLP